MEVNTTYRGFDITAYIETGIEGDSSVPGGTRQVAEINDLRVEVDGYNVTDMLTGGVLGEIERKDWEERG